MEVKTLADLKLLHRAINGGWNVTDEMKQRVVDQAANLVGDSDPKIALLAMKVLISADSADDKKALAEQKRQEAEHARKLQLLELAIKHGLVADVGSGVRALDSSTSTVTE